MKKINYLRLGVNIDHVATIRNARGGTHPDPVAAALLAAKAGADGITAHLREDRRHISEHDIERLKTEISLPLNLEMAATEEMLSIALKTRPNAVCIVPEKRRELTTEGGLNVIEERYKLSPIIHSLQDAGIKVSLFIDANLSQLDMAKTLGADIIEIHTGNYCHTSGTKQKSELRRIYDVVSHAEHLGIECHAGHGLNFDTVKLIAAIPYISELNIGHFLIGEAIFAGLDSVIKKMREVMDKARDN